MTSASSNSSSSSNNLATTNSILPTTTTTTPPTTHNVTTPSLSSFSFSNLSPEVAQILAQAKGNATSAVANHLPTTITTTIPTNTLINGSTTMTSVTPTITNHTVAATPNLPAPPHLLSALLNMTRTAGHETQNGKEQMSGNALRFSSRLFQYHRAIQSLISYLIFH